MKQMHWFIVMSLALLIFFSSCEKEVGQTAVINLEDPTPEQEIEIGIRLKEQILRDTHNFPLYYGQSAERKEEFLTYLNRLVHTVAITSPVVHRNDYDWNVNVIDSPEQHAFTAPGGAFFVYTGLLRELKNEAELMSIMAHELSYMDRALVTQKLGEEYDPVVLGDLYLGQRVAQIDNMALSLRDFDYNGEDVLIADSFAINVLCPFDYQVTSLTEVVARLDSINNETGEIMWINKRIRSVEGLDNVKGMEIDCGYNERYFEERYKTMLSKM